MQSKTPKICTVSINDAVDFMTDVYINCKFRFCHEMHVVSLIEV